MMWSSRINGTIFYAYQVCPREAWFYYHRLNPDKEHPLLDLGRLVHETSYTRARKEIFVDRLLKIDLFRGELVAEIKRSQRHKEAARLQLAFYLYYLKNEKGLEMEGVILFPRERRSERLKLTLELENRIRKLLQEMQETFSNSKPPPLQRCRWCRSCAFEEVCWA
ncbi:CRISPR-associated protein Cas4 [Thermosulfurimonas sp. F29]|nr:CRISPR-associated protein Cas4 [Thermosulfurimonas sp. F29]